MGGDPVPGLHQVLRQSAEVALTMESYLKGLQKDIFRLEKRVSELQQKVRELEAKEGEG